MVIGWKTEPKSRISTASTSISPVVIAVMKPCDDLALDLGVAGGGDPDALGQADLLDDLVEGLLRGAELEAALQIGADGGAADAVVAVDRARALAEADLGHGGERDRDAAGVGDAQRRDVADVGAGGFVELHADRHQPVAGVELGEIGADIADGGDAHRFRDRLGRDAETRRPARAWA